MTQNTINSIAVYCGSNTGSGSKYLDAAASLGTLCADNGIRVIYGGTHKGLMGALADAALAAGGEVYGVLSQRLFDKGHLHTGLTQHEILPSMKERKHRMVELADAFIALPGGIGTLEEFMEVWTLNQLGELDKPAGLFNIANYYTPLMGFVDHMIAESFLPVAHRQSIVIENTAAALIDGLLKLEKTTVPKWM